MDEILEKLASAAGLDPDTAKGGLGAVFSFLKEHLPANLFGQVEKSVPDAQGMADSFDATKAEPSGGGGLLASASGLVGSLMGEGAGSAAKLVGKLGSAGLSLSQIQTFLPKVVEVLRPYLPADLIAKIEGLVAGGSAEAAGS